MLRRQALFRRSYVHWKTFLGLNSVNYDIIYFGFQLRFFFFQFFLIIEASRSHSDTTHSVGLLLASDQPDAETSTWQHTTLTKYRHPCPRRNFFFFHKTEFYFPYSLYTVNILSYIPTTTFPSVTNLLAHFFSLSCFWPSIRRRPPGSLSFHPPLPLFSSQLMSTIKLRTCHLFCFFLLLLPTHFESLEQFRLLPIVTAPLHTPTGHQSMIISK